MPNPIYNNMQGPNRKGGEGPSPKPQGTPPNLSESKTGPNRSGGDPTTGKRGPFYVKKQGI